MAFVLKMRNNSVTYLLIASEHQICNIRIIYFMHELYQIAPKCSIYDLQISQNAEIDKTTLPNSRK